ncbi:MAG: hypothetical protein IPJ69_10035 [Deltaproteobacteria bacterium]|nr:MAG: hypothetical protein IPJ69_10035 [Deltaproteobacteria bacterium]
MAEIASKIASSVTDKMVSEVGTQGGQAGQVTGQTENSPFAQVLASKVEATGASSHGKLNGQVLESFGLVPEKKIGAISAQGLDISPSEIRAGQEIRTNGKVMDVLTEVNRGAHQMEDMITLATSGQKFTPAELLAMQAGLSQKVFQLEITSKVVETGASSTKQVLQQGASG